MSIDSQVLYAIQYRRVLKHIRQENFTYTTHAKSQMDARKLTKSVVENVLFYGVHESAKDEFHKDKESWSFLFSECRPKKKIHVHVSATATTLCIVTAIDKLLTKPVTDFPTMQSYKRKEPEKSFDDILERKIKEHKKQSLD